MPHPAMSANHVAVITGGASGIGLAAAMRFAGLGMKVCIADIGAERLAEAATKLSSVAKGGDADVMTAEVDVSRIRGRRQAGSRGAEAVRRHRHPDEQCRHRPRQQQLWAAGELAAHSRRQSLGRHPRHAGICAPHDRTRTARAHHQHRLQAGDHHAARQSRLQCLQSRRESADRGAAARTAQHRGLPDQRASPDSRSRLHRPHRARPQPRSLPAPGRRSRPSIS